MTLIIQIRQQQFELDREYKAGDVLTAGEALALNQLLAERVRKAAAPWVARLVRTFGVLTSEQHDDLQKKINNVALNYEFSPRPGYRPEVPLEYTVKEVALQEAQRWGQRNGITPDSPEVRNKYLELCSDSGVRDRARELVRSRLGVAEKLLEGIV